MVNNVKKNANNIISLAGNVSYRKINLGSETMKKNGLWQPHILTNISGSYFTDNDSNTYSPYKIFKKNSWVFKGVKLKGNYFGNKSLNTPLNKDGCSGHELDKCVVNRNNIIAKGTNGRGGGDMLYYKVGKRKIFSVGSIVFTGGVYVDDIIEKITLNVLKNFI
jgi:hypothetical protein